MSPGRSSPLLGLLLLGLGATSAPLSGGIVGLVPDPDPRVGEDLTRGARLAIERLEGEVELAVAEAPEGWSDAGTAINSLVDDAGADVLLAPPDRATAHLVAQLATRRHVPAIATASRGSDVAGSVTGAGSWWMVVCAPPSHPPEDLARALGRPPREAETAAWTAVLVARDLLRLPGSVGGDPDGDWRSALPPPCRAPVPKTAEAEP